jgi:ribonuclease E
MTSESKILTVSYGTFSCTLEGFDDPFITMKAIAEYFRDLTAEDRYFGAEPPQPDAAMLHRIADREVARLVGSKSHEAGLVLRPSDLAPEGRVTGRPRTTRAPAEEPAPPIVEPTLQESMPSGVVAKLARIRDAVSQPPDESRPEDVLNAFHEEFQDLEPAPESEVPAAGDAASRIGALLQDPEADLAADASETNIFADVAAPEAAGDRALAAAAEAEAEAEAPFLEVEDLLPEMLAPEMGDDGGIFPETTVGAYQDDPLAAVDALDDTVEAAADQFVDAPEGDGLEAAPEVAAVAEPEAEVHAPLPTTRTNGKSRRVSSRVVRIHPDDDGAEDQPDGNSTRMATPDEADEVSRLLRRAEDVMADEENRRRLDSLAHLKAAIASTEADRAAGETTKPAGSADADAYRDDLAHVVQPDPEPAQPEVRPRRKTVSVHPQEPRPGTIRPGMFSPPPLVLVSEQRIDRVPLEAETAPAPAAKAPSPLSTGPARPGIDGQPLVALRTGRLTGAIGIGAAAASPNQPQERIVLNRAAPVASADMDDDDGVDEHLSEAVESGLASFADNVGAKSLAEMLEAAAAYATCVEKRDQFTRPQLMRRLMASAGGKPISREDGLRSFGTLLRTGRVEKVGRGHYVLAANSPYLAEARRLN